LKMLCPASAFSRGKILDFPTGKRSKNHAAAGQSKARALCRLEQTHLLRL
jgi:hypothetical protein